MNAITMNYSIVESTTTSLGDYQKVRLVFNRRKRVVYDLVWGGAPISLQHYVYISFVMTRTEIINKQKERRITYTVT